MHLRRHPRADPSDRERHAQDARVAAGGAAPEGHPLNRLASRSRSHPVGGSHSPSRPICPQIQIGKPTLPEHGAIASQAGDGDGERLLQTSKTGEGRAPVRSAELEPGDGRIAAVPADDLPGEGVSFGRPGDSQLIRSCAINQDDAALLEGAMLFAARPIESRSTYVPRKRLWRPLTMIRFA